MVNESKRIRDLKSKLIGMAFKRLSEQGRRLETIEDLEGMPKLESSQDTIVYLHYKKGRCGEPVYKDINSLLRFVKDTPEYIEFSNLVKKYAN